MVLRTLSAVVVLAGLMLAPAVAAAQTDQARIMGLVTDGSGGALPGVTVTVSGGTLRPAPYITDSSGRYLTAWLPPGDYTVTFGLSGFETRVVNGLKLSAGQTVILDQQLALAALAETVQVTAPAPPPPPPPPPPAPVRYLPARPEIVPVDKEMLLSVCGPRQPAGFSRAIGKIVSHRDSDRQLLGTGDIVRIDSGTDAGIEKGQNLVVRSRVQTSDGFTWKRSTAIAEQASALVQIVEVSANASTAMVVYACSELMAGDTVEPWVRQPAFFAVSTGTPHFDEPAKIVIGEHGRNTGAAGQMMVIDHGIMQGVQRGQRLTIFRRIKGDALSTVTIGDGVIVAIRSDSATILIERATDAAAVGDMVALHR